MLISTQEKNKHEQFEQYRYVYALYSYVNQPRRCARIE